MLDSYQRRQLERDGHGIRVSIVNLLGAEGFPKSGIRIFKAHRVGLAESDLRVIVDQIEGAHAIRHRNATDGGQAKILRGILSEGVAKLLQARIPIRLIAGDKHRALRMKAEQMAVHIGERDPANTRLVDEAQHAEVAFVPVVLGGAQHHPVMRTVQEPMPECEPLQRSVHGAVIRGSEIPLFMTVVTDRAVDSLRQAEVFRQVVSMGQKEKAIRLCFVAEERLHKLQRSQLCQLEREQNDPKCREAPNQPHCIEIRSGKFLKGMGGRATASTQRGHRKSKAESSEQ